MLHVNSSLRSILPPSLTTPLFLQCSSSRGGGSGTFRRQCNSTSLRAAALNSRTSSTPQDDPSPSLIELSTSSSQQTPDSSSVAVLSISSLPVPIRDLWAALSDPKHSLFVDLHRSLGSEDFKLSGDPQKGAAEVENAASFFPDSRARGGRSCHLTLEFATPLPLVGLRARNKEVVVMTWNHSGSGFDEAEGFDASSVCSTAGVPLGGSFVNHLRWEARAVGPDWTSLTITAHTEFFKPVFGPIKVQIERESIKGIQDAYRAFAAILNARWPQRAAASPAAPLITNLRSPGGLSASIEGSSRPSAAPKAPREDPSGAGSPAEELLHYSATREAFKGLSMAEIEARVVETWSEWSSNSYRLLRTSQNGQGRGVCWAEETPNAPSPEAAMGVLREAMPAWRKTGMESRAFYLTPLLLGLVECLRLVPPRAPSGGGQIVATPSWPSPSAPSLSFALVPCAIHVLGGIGRHLYWREEMSAACDRLPEATFAGLKDVENVAWALRITRHWTEHLGLLEAEALRQWSAVKRRERKSKAGWRPVALDVRSLARIAQCLARLGHAPHGLIATTASKVEAQFDWDTACSLGWAIAIADDDVGGPATAALLRALQAHGSAEEIAGAVHLSRLWQFFATLAQLRPGLLQGETVERIMAAAQADWESTALPKEKKMISAAQKEVHQAMLSMGHAGAELESTACGLSVDISVPGSKLAVEVDGIYHFARNRPDLTVGSTLWKRRMLEAQGWMMVNVNVDSWAKVRGPEREREFLAALVESEQGKSVEAGEVEEQQQEPRQ